MTRWTKLLPCALALLALLAVPRTLAGWEASAWFEGDRATEEPMARGVAAGVIAQSTPTAFETGQLRFDGQATIAIHQMALLGLGQIVLAHPSMRDAYLPAMRASGKRLADPATLAYAAKVYGTNGVVAMKPGDGHAYLGYVNLGLGMLRLVDPAIDPAIARLHDRLTRELTERLAASPTGLIETYPGEAWPPDVAAVAGSIGLHARATGADHREMLARWAPRFEGCAVHASGMLVQRTRTGTCTPVDAPRGSGTAVAAYFLSFATPDLSRKLWTALSQNVLVIDGFGGVREYAPGFSGEGDGNAGPIVFGVSVGGTGFGLGAARANGDRARFVELYRSTSLLGIPTRIQDHTVFAVGGLLGNALLLAMLTARPS